MYNIEKLENPARLKELNPVETLKRIGLKNDHTLCDIGAGSGIFTIPASRITNSKVYALEINHDMLSLIDEKAKAQDINNIELRKVENNHFNIDGNSIDVAIIVTVLHEINNKSAFLAEVKRILKATGHVAVIEFHKHVTPMGPTIDHRLGYDDLMELLSENGFILNEKFDLGENFYCAVFNSNNK